MSIPASVPGLMPGLAQHPVSRFARRLGKHVALFIQAVKAWSEDRCAAHAAALAFYTAFSLAPALVIVIAVGGFFFGPDAVQGRLYAEIRGLIGTEGATAVQAMVASAWKSGRSSWATMISVGALVLGATTTFAQLNSALNLIWRYVPDVSSRWALISLVRVRLVSFALLVGIGFLIVVLLVLDAAISFAVEFLLGEAQFGWLKFVQRFLTFILLAVAFGGLLKVLPDAPVRWSDTRWGALTAALLFSLGKNLFGLYLAQAGTANAFGAAGSLAVVLMWLYFSAAVFLLGAEMSAVHAAHRNSESAKAQEIPVLLRPAAPGT